MSNDPVTDVAVQRELLRLSLHNSSRSVPLQLATVAVLVALGLDGGRGLAISHTPLVERAALGLTGDSVERFGECEGILVSLDGVAIAIEELRLGGGPADA